MMQIPPWLTDLLQRTDAFGNRAMHWAQAVLVAGALLLGLWIVKRLMLWRLGHSAEKRPADWRDGLLDLVRRTRMWLVLVPAGFVGSLMLTLPAKASGSITSAAIIALLAQMALWADGLLRFGLARHAKRRTESDPASLTTLAALGFLARVTVWTLVVLAALANLGVNVTAMVAGLGIGGVAVALAAQSILGDLFASASIVLDKPFVLGDCIIVDKDTGTVERIGLKTTRVRSLDGEQIIFSNAELLKGRIRNMQRMSDRRVLFTAGVTYQTPVEKLEAIPAMLREAVTAQSPVRFDRAHLKSCGDFAVIYEVVYFVLSPDPNVAMDIQQAINLAMLRRFAAEGIEFAYPTQTVHCTHAGSMERVVLERP